MAERYPEAELVLDDELVYDDSPRRSAFLRREERPEDIVREGEVLAGKYRVERIPGRNGLGVMVQVRHMELGQDVTLKFLVPEACAYPEFVQRFVREARAAVKIQGEHVARVTDVGRLESGAPYMVREFLRGPDLAEVLKVRGPLPVAEATDYIIQACEGVAEGHALGVVHRNLRPTSLVVTRRSDGMPLVKVFDFAASESLHVNPFTERAVSLVGTSAIMASLPYLAPEQIRDPHDVDFRADVYSLGAVLFELLTGSPVYAAETAPALLAQVAADPAPAVRTLRSEVPGELDHIVLRCLAKNRAIRYPSIAELALALRQFASDETAASVDRIVRLGKRTTKLPDLGDHRVPSPLPPAPVESAAPPAQASTRGRHGTLVMQANEPSTPPPIQVTRASQHDDVTTINPYAAYAAPVVINPEPRPEQARSEPARSEPARVEQPRQASQPAPLRSMGPPPLRTPAPPPLSVPPPLTPPPQRGAVNTQRYPNPLPAPGPLLAGSEQVDAKPSPTSVPSPRSSISGGLTRSWAVPDEPAPAIFTQRRLAIAAIAACATLGAVFATRSRAPATAAAAAPVVAAPPKAVAPTPPPAPEPPPAVVASASAAPAPAAPVPAAPAPATPVSAAAPAVAAPPTPVVNGAAAAPRPVAPVAATAPRAPAATAARRPAPSEPAASDATHKPAPAAEQKVASSRPAAGGNLFDDPN